jgi:hypothetical protein
VGTVNGDAGCDSWAWAIAADKAKRITAEVKAIRRTGFLLIT